MADRSLKPAANVAPPVRDKALHHLGQTRSSLQADHALLTPDSFVRAPLPGMERASAIVHAAPAMGSAFTQYTAEIEPGGSLGIAEGQRFIFVLEGEAHLQASGEEHVLAKGGYAYLPSEEPSALCAAVSSRIAVIEKAYQSLDGPLSAAQSGRRKGGPRGTQKPGVLVGKEDTIVPQAFMGDPALLVRALLPDDSAFDFAVNTMMYQPGASLPMVESHIMEHGLLMLEGEGIYRLGDRWYPVAAGDFIWMAPYCPQWFGALGKVPSKYLIYKPWNRHPLR
jgi:(S)-ureidoglycine aminohydrolase